MNLWQKLMAAKAALNYGEQLADSTTWKKYTVAVNALTGLIAAVLPFVEGLDAVDNQTVRYIADGIFGLFSVYNIYATTATTKKIGI